MAPKPSHSLMDQALRLGEREASDLIAGEHDVEVEPEGTLGGGAAGDEADGPGGGGSASSSELRQLYRGRKFLFPLLDQGPNNQCEQRTRDCPIASRLAARFTASDLVCERPR